MSLRETFFSIGSENNLDEFFLIAFPDYIFAPTVDQSSYSDNINTIRIRQVRTKPMDCLHASDYNLENFHCFYRDYSGSNKETSPINGLNEPWAIYQSADETGVNYVFKGEFSDYDGSGYVLDVPYDTEMYDFIDLYTDLLSKGWMSEATRAIFLSYTTYLPSSDSWLDVFVAVEISVSGSYLAQAVSADFMTMDKNGVSEAVNRRIAIVRLILSFIFATLFVLRVLIQTDGKRNYWYIISFYGLLDLLSFLSMLIGAAVDLSVITDPDSAFDDNVFTDFSEAVAMYKMAIGFNCFSVILIFFQILRSMRFYQPIDFALTILEAVPSKQASANIFFFLILLGPILIGFILLSMNIWGPFLKTYHSFDQSLISLLFLVLGAFDNEELMKFDPGWTVGFIILFFFFILFFLTSFYGAFYMDAYRIVRIYWNFGDRMKAPAQRIPLNTQLKRLSAWLFAWVPQKLLTKLVRKPKDKQEDKEKPPNQA